MISKWDLWRLCLQELWRQAGSFPLLNVLRVWNTALIVTVIEINLHSRNRTDYYLNIKVELWVICSLQFFLVRFVVGLESFLCVVWKIEFPSPSIAWWLSTNTTASMFQEHRVTIFSQARRYIAEKFHWLNVCSLKTDIGKHVCNFRLSFVRHIQMQN